MAPIEQREAGFSPRSVSAGTDGGRGSESSPAVPTTSLLYAASDGRHLPPSHPVLLRMKEMVRQHPAAVSVALEEDERDRDQITFHLEEMARWLAGVPERPLSVEQRRMGMAIVRELHRRARDPRQVRRSPLYEAARIQEPGEGRPYAAIAAAVKNDPERTLAAVAADFGVSVQLVSRIAIANGARRRLRTQTP